ncbi:hypothetical protein BKE38_12595 [Pseudoroseomonas deserti]|uniref:Uncharacterized protein n=1 Tax=Teichococcus deserti TaxID=1817963 RepID=A0A1V2H401_9PROT|nr:hypothetical protein [Pseudoroseomonas deserti]ONG53294.1 hypothetical protein BKE38_12595 [Pseudoroseomonas deserti]
MQIGFRAPLWLLRWVTKRNPWLLSDQGTVTRSRRLDLGFMGIEVDASIRLDDDARARLERAKPPAQ